MSALEVNQDLAASDRIPPVYAALVDDAVEALSAELGDALHSIYTAARRPVRPDLPARISMSSWSWSTSCPRWSEPQLRS